MTAVLKHELANYFHSLTAYIFGAFLLVFVGIGAMLYNIPVSYTHLDVYKRQIYSCGSAHLFSDQLQSQYAGLHDRDIGHCVQRGIGGFE